jgi:two-component system, NarL family, response regulator LiaR
MSEPSGPSILIVDDHELVGASLAMSLRAEGMRACHHGPADVHVLLESAAAEPGGLALLDLDLGREPGTGCLLDGVDLVEPLCDRGWRTLVLSGTRDRARIGAALDAGAVASVPKQAPFPTLLAAVRAALAGRPVMPPQRRQEFIELHRARTAERRELAAKLDRLTSREREVLAELAEGRRAQAVADRYVVSLATVRTQIRAVLTKLEVGSQLEAVALYRKARPG